MWTFKAVLVAWLLASCPLFAAGTGLDDPDAGMPAFDQAGLAGPDLREAVEDYEQLCDDLARETLRLDKSAHGALLKSLKLDYGLGDQVDNLQRCLDDNEAILQIQTAIKAEQARMKALSADDPRQDAEERKLLGLQSDLISTVAGLRQRLAGLLKDLPDLRQRDLKTWFMVSAGQLRHRREDAEAAAKAQPPPEAAPLDAAGISPSGETVQPLALSATVAPEPQP